MPSESVKVIVRVRPMNEREKNKQCTNIIATDVPNLQVTLTNPAESDTQKVFSYDSVFGMDSTQQTVYEESAFQLVESVLEGYNGTIFAYGQTGCGKTHTMMGVTSDENLKGVIPRAFDHIFGNIKSTTSNSQKNYLIRCSFIEIYNEEIHDLVGDDVKARLDLKESSDKGVFIKGLSMHIVKSVPEIQKLMTLGFKNRSVGETAMNKDSSRSHSIFTIYVETSETDPKGNPRITLGKLNLVDLAGSERQSKTGATGDRLKEANKINLSLSALGNVISALVDGKSSHIPYRDSKLTRLLQDSLGGNTKTVMIANISPASDNYDETLGTLRYASRAKNIKNQPKVNEDPKDAMLREYAEEIMRLKAMLENGEGGKNVGSPSKNGGNKKLDGDAGASEKHKGKKNDSSSNHHETMKGYENQLKAKEDEIMDERKKREELENRLLMMQQQLVVGGEKNDKSSSGGDSEETKKYQQMLRKLKNQNKHQEELLRQKEQKEEELLEAEKKYNSMQEEVEEQRKIIKRLKKKLKDANSEIKDLDREHELNKEDLLDTIRLLERDIKINNAIMAYLLSPEELEKIRAKARWHDDRNEFVVPPFIVRAKKVKFPKLGFNQALNMVHEEWENRDIEFINPRNNHNNKNHYIPIQQDDDEEGYPSDNDWEESRGQTPNQYTSDNSPARSNNKGYPSHSPIVNSYGGSNYNSGANIYDGRNTGSKNMGKDTFDARSFRDAGRSTNQSYHKLEMMHTPVQKKNPTKGVMLDPINQNTLSNNGFPEKNKKNAFSQPQNSLATLNTGSLPPMKGKPQLQPINHLGGNNKTMKLSFKATLLINNDGTNAELQNMTSHVKGY